MSDTDCRRQVSPQHLEILTQYMERYPLLALSNTRNREEKVMSWKLWDKIAKTLNKIDGRVMKSGRNWSRYWADLKFKTRRKYTMIQSAKTNGRRVSIILTQWEKRILKILTDDDGNLLPNAHQMTSYEPFQKTKSKTDEPENPAPTPEVINIPESEHTYKHPNLHTHNNIDPIEVPEDKKNEKECPRTTQKRAEELRMELLEFQLRRQKELFEIEKTERREKHQLEMDILRLRKDILLKELKNMP